MAQAPPSEPIGTRDIDSTPPASTRSSQPEATFWAAMLTASRPDAQKRLSWTPATVCGRPALIAAVLAMSAPWSPIGVTQPRTTSSMRFGSSCPLRASVSWISPTTRSTGLVVCSDPLLLPLPRGVRTASNTSASVAAMPNLLYKTPRSSRLLTKRQWGGGSGAISRGCALRDGPVVDLLARPPSKDIEQYAEPDGQQDRDEDHELERPTAEAV